MPAKKKTPPKLRALCDKVIAHIKKYPLVRQQGIITELACGTAACLAGHTVLAVAYPNLPPSKWDACYGRTSGWLGQATNYFLDAGYSNAHKESLAAYFGSDASKWPSEARDRYDNGERSQGAIKLLEMIKAGKA